jgi:hemerythrin-like domain-containing protein
MKNKTPLKTVSLQGKTGAHTVVKLLLADHKLLRTLMKKVKSHKASPQDTIVAFKVLKKAVISHVKAEEKTFLALIKDHPKFKDHALESYEEHRIHEYIYAGIEKVKEKDRKVQQMKSFCEALEHHLDEEEEDIFPRFKKYFATSTSKKVGRNYSKVRKATDTLKRDRGATRFKT